MIFIYFPERELESESGGSNLCVSVYRFALRLPVTAVMLFDERYSIISSYSVV
jgi:hypothetical protein